MQINTDDSEERSIDLAPLLDCIFLLLIFFMVTTTFKLDRTEHLDIPLNVPRVAGYEQSSQEQQTKALTISVDRRGQYFLNKIECGLVDLHRILRKDAAVNPERKIVLAGDRLAAFEQIAEVMNLCHLLGLTNVSVKVERGE
ncbi:transport energizing protein, ExbD/TolR family [Verrucomicrobiia bacterium DG1235]|nr:transport energizing protein, ExbD/TolR family [Verrucomicrobiae bacterium DG1235]